MGAPSDCRPSAVGPTAPIRSAARLGASRSPPSGRRGWASRCRPRRSDDPRGPRRGRSRTRRSRCGGRRQSGSPAMMAASAPARSLPPRPAARRARRQSTPRADRTTSPGLPGTEGGSRTRAARVTVSCPTVRRRPPSGSRRSAGWSRRSESNRQLPLYERGTLPLSHFGMLEPEAGIGPTLARYRLAVLPLHHSGWGQRRESDSRFLLTKEAFFR